MVKMLQEYKYKKNCFPTRTRYKIKFKLQDDLEIWTECPNTQLKKLTDENELNHVLDRWFLTIYILL